VGSEPARLDVLTMGRVGVDLYPLQAGVALEDVTTFGRYLGGSATNVAVAAARLGRSAAVITRTGNDPFGRFVHHALKGYGVGDQFVTGVPGLPTPVTFCEIFPPDDFPIYFYRYPKAPDLEIRAEELDYDAIRAARVFWVTATGLCAEPSRSATLAALEARAAGAPGGAARAPGGAGEQPAVTVLDLDYRPMFWASREAAREAVGAALGLVTVAVGNLDECDMAVGETEPHRAARALLDRGARLAVVKQGPRGVLAATPAGVAESPPFKIQILNGLGAGDAFGGALCHGVLAGWDTARVIRFANAAGALVASRLACSDAMPTEAEVDALVAGTSDVR
jgi:5-dehydro-2-deoxygluconokinase